MIYSKRAVPGVSLKSYFPEKDNNAIRIVCENLKRLHQAPMPRTNLWPHIKDWLLALDKNLSIPVNYLHKARRLREKLIATSVAPVLLHGDLQGVIGEPAYEIAAFIRNPMPELLAHSNASNIIDNRITQFAEILHLSKQRIIDWCYVQAVLSWTWALEDNSDGTYFKKLTELFNGY